MVRLDYFDTPDNIPEYYDTMYLDGFEPWQIMAAAHKTMIQRLNPVDEEISIGSEVNVK